jgi:hypothetical protein
MHTGMVVCRQAPVLVGFRIPILSESFGISGWKIDKSSLFSMSHGWRVAILHRRIGVVIDPSVIGSLTVADTARTIGKGRTHRCNTPAAPISRLFPPY